MTGNWKIFLGYLAALAGISVVVLLFAFAFRPASPTTIALVLLVAILLSSWFLGVGPGLAAAVAGALCFNFFFLPPAGTFAIAKSVDLVAFAVFLFSSLIVSGLASSAAKRTREAEEKRLELEKLQKLARILIGTPYAIAGSPSVAEQIVNIFGLEYCGIHILGKGKRWKRVSLSAGYPPKLRLPGTGLAGEPGSLEGLIEENDKAVRYFPLEIPTGLVGMLALKSDRISGETVKAIASLVALGFQRGRSKSAGPSSRLPES